MTDINNKAMKDSLTGAYSCKAMKDSLTGAYSRKAIIEVLPLAQGAIYSDLDNFKMINDYFGHNQGDKILVEIAKIAQTLAQQNQGIIFRLGGNEFALLFQTISSKNLENIATELYQQVLSMRVEQFLDIEVEQVNISCSVGVAFSSIPIKSEELIDRADEACYWSKRNKPSQNVSDRVIVWEERKDNR